MKEERDHARAAAAAAQAAAAQAVAAETVAAESAAAAAAAAEAEAAAAMAPEVVAAEASAAEAPAEAVVPTGVVVRIGSAARSGAVAPAAEAVAARPEQQISRQVEVAAPPKVTYTLQIEREFGRDPRLGPPPPPTLASPLPTRPAELPSPHRHRPAVDQDGTREAGQGYTRALTPHASSLTLPSAAVDHREHGDAGRARAPIEHAA